MKRNFGYYVHNLYLELAFVLLLFILSNSGLQAQTSSELNVIAWSPDGTRIATADRDNIIHIYDAVTGALLQSRVGGMSIMALTWSPDSTHIVSGDELGEVVMWDLDTDQVVLVNEGREAPIVALDWRPTGTHIAVSVLITYHAFATVVDIYNAITLELEKILVVDPEPSEISSMAWNPIGNRLAVLSYSTGVVIDYESDEHVLLDEGFAYSDITWSPDGEKLAGNTMDSIRIWRASDGQAVKEVLFNGNLLNITWSPDGTRLAGSRVGGGISVWDVTTGELLETLSSDDTGRGPIAWSPDSTQLAHSNSDGGLLISLAPPPANYPPTASAGPDQAFIDSDNSGSESVLLDGSASSDSDGSIVSYVWTLDGVEIATGVMPTVTLAVGVHTITLTVTDDDGATGIDEVVITVSSPAASATLTFQVASAADDVNEDGSAFTPADPLIWIGTGASASGSYTGLRFTDVAIPPGATVAAAYVEFHNPQPAWITLGLELAAEAADDSAAFSSSSRPSQRPLTVERVQHNSDLHWQGGDWHALDDISAVLQEVVDRPGWHSGSSLSVILHGTDSPFGRKYVSSYESDPAHAPRLVVRLPRPASPCS